MVTLPGWSPNEVGASAAPRRRRGLVAGELRDPAPRPPLPMKVSTAAEVLLPPRVRCKSSRNSARSIMVAPSCFVTPPRDRAGPPSPSVAEPHSSGTGGTHSPHEDPLSGPEDLRRMPRRTHGAADIRLGIPPHGQAGELRRHPGQDLVVGALQIMQGNDVLALVGEKLRRSSMNQSTMESCPSPYTKKVRSRALPPDAPLPSPSRASSSRHAPCTRPSRRPFPAPAPPRGSRGDAVGLPVSFLPAVRAPIDEFQLLHAGARPPEA